MTATVVGPGGAIEIENEVGDPITVQEFSGTQGRTQLFYTGDTLTSVVVRDEDDVVVRTSTLIYDGPKLVEVVRT